MSSRHLLGLLLVVGPSAFAQDNTTGKDQEDRGSSVEEAKGKLDVHAFFETEWHEYDNLDLRPRDETSDQSILDSDDRNGFAFTGVSLDLGYQIDPSLRMVVATSYRGLWGNDQIGNVNRFGGFLYFNSLYIEYKPKTSYAPIFRLGRQRMDLGGMGGAREFIWGDVIDALRVDFPLGDIGTLITIPVNVQGLSAENSDVNFVSYVGQQSAQAFGFRGDRMTRRHGAELVIAPKAVPGLDARVYGFFTHVGALGSGSDISYQGRLGNFSDKDWTTNVGVRAAYTIKNVITPYAHFDASFGIDRKELVTYDVDTNGFAWGAGVVAEHKTESKKDIGGRGELQYFDSTGPAYAADGQQFSHGFTGMKARQVGGLVANRFMGWHPTAYLSSFGVEDTPQQTDRKSGTRVISLDGTLDLPGPVSVGAGYWFIQDKGVTALDFDKVDTITPPYGYSREEFRAEQRLGKVLGHEVDVNAGLDLGKHLQIVLQAGVLLPGEYYKIEIARVAGTALGSATPQTAWDFSGGARVSF
jgi:hypothetical protein